MVVPLLGAYVEYWSLEGVAVLETTFPVFVSMHILMNIQLLLAVSSWCLSLKWSICISPCELCASQCNDLKSIELEFQWLWLECSIVGLYS